jgi:hypothetical protein
MMISRSDSEFRAQPARRIGSCRSSARLVRRPRRRRWQGPPGSKSEVVSASKDQQFGPSQDMPCFAGSRQIARELSGKRSDRADCRASVGRDLATCALRNGAWAPGIDVSAMSPPPRAGILAAGQLRASRKRTTKRCSNRPGSSNRRTVGVILQRGTGWSWRSGLPSAGRNRFRPCPR